MRLLSLLCLTTLLATAARAQEYAPKFPPFKSERPDLRLPHPAIVAARYGDAEKIRQFLADGVPVNACDKDGQTMVRAALEFNHADLARDLIQRGFNPNLVYRYNDREELVEIGSACLPAAVRAGAEDIVDLLLAKGMAAPVYAWDPNSIGDPLTFAVANDSVSIFRKLLHSYGPERAAEKIKVSAAYRCLDACKSVAMLEALLDAGVDVDTEGGPGEHILHTYARRGWAEGVAVLLAHGADATVKSFRLAQLPEEVAATPAIARQIHIAAGLKHLAPATPAGESDPAAESKKSAFPTEVLAAVLQGDEETALTRAAHLSLAEINATDDRGWTILNYALKEKKIRLGHALVDAGADVTRLTTLGSAVIGFAASTQDVALVKKIAAKGAKVDAAKNSWTALMIAVDARDYPMVETLLALGAKVDPPRPRYGAEKWSTALQVAARTGDLKLIQRMIDAGGDLQAIDTSGESVMHWAVRSGSVAALQFLVQRGVPAGMKTAEGTNTLTLAAFLGKTEIVEALLALGVTHPDAESYAELGGHLATRDALIKWKQQHRPDDLAAYWNNGNLTAADVRNYIARGRDVNFVEGENTPLQWMAWHGDAAAVKLLLDAGADVKLSARGNITPPVFFAFFNRETRSDDQALALLRLFIEHGASPNARTNLESDDDPEHLTGSTLVTFAASLSYWKCVRYLLDHGANPSLRDAFGHRNAFDELADCRKLDATERTEIRALLEAHAQPDPDEQPRPVPPLLARPKVKSASL